MRLEHSGETEDKNRLQEAAEKAAGNVAADDELAELWGKLGFKPFYLEEQRSFQKRSFYTFADMKRPDLGRELQEVYERWGNLALDHPLSSRNVPLERMMFFDTETTGLSTGAGNSIFLIGYARVHDDGVEVTQHMLAEPSSEAAFLYGFLQEFHDDDYLVSYNGKAFDWPQVKSRHVFVRDQVPRLPAFGHIDLLHAARRLWKHELPSCRLSVVEREKLSIRRLHDTPGSMAPLLYYDYLHENKPDHLRGIIEHNDQDVRSLIHLYVAISQRLFQCARPASVTEQIQLGKWCEQTGWEEAAVSHYEKALEIPGSGKEAAHFQLGRIFKKQKRYQEATAQFINSISVSSTPLAEGFIELAKLHEHQEKSYERAHYFSREALRCLKASQKLTSAKRKLIKDVEKRIERLEGKLRGSSSFHNMS